MLETGDYGEHFSDAVVGLLPSPSKLDDPARRLVEVLVRFSQYSALGRWLENEEDYQSMLVEAFSQAGREAAELVGAVIDRFPLERANGEPTSAGIVLLAQSDEDLLQGVRRTNIFSGNGLAALVEFLRKRRPEWLDVVGPVIVAHPEGRIPELACLALLAASGNRYAEPLFSAWSSSDAPSRIGLKKLPATMRTICHDWGVATKIALGFKFARVRPEVFQKPVQEYALSILNDSSSTFDAGALVSIAGTVATEGTPEHVEALKVWLGHPHRCVPVLRALTEKGGAETAPLLRAALDLPRPELRLLAAARLLDLRHEGQAVQRLLQSELAGPAPLPGFVAIAATWQPAVFADSLWNLLGNKSKTVRDGAVRGLSSLGEAAVPGALKLLAARKASVRESGVHILLLMRTPEVLRALEQHAENETDDSVRDQILLALQSRSEPPDPSALRKRMERSLAKIAAPPVPWIDLPSYGPLHWKDGSPLDKTAVRYLLYRQSRAKEMCADIEARAVYAQIDRTTSGAFALKLLTHYLGVSQLPAERWVMALAGLLGDDQVVPMLNRQIAAWAENSRGKMAEYAVGAMALLGSDLALSALNALSIRYNTKFRNIGSAAADAFQTAAAAQGVSADELGDRVVPSLGLPRTETISGKPFELAVSLDGKLTLHDVTATKVVKALPKSAPADLVAEIKDLKAALKEVWKGQVSRLEGLMVRQMRWPVERWKELYLGHPVLFPFSVRLVWGVYSGEGKLTDTFRALEDRTLTSAEDEQFSLPGHGCVGIVHPLELAPDLCLLWQKHLADYAVTPAFMQLGRPVVRATEVQAGEREFSDLEGTDLNALTFRGRAEKLGWRRGSVCDAGGIRFYHKPFPAAGAEALVELESMYVGAGMDADITLGSAFFVKAGSVATGSYVYDEPESLDDPRVLPFKDVPPIAFSEALGDLRRIAGASSAEDETL